MYLWLVWRLPSVVRYALAGSTVTRTRLAGEAWSAEYGCTCSKIRARWPEIFFLARASWACWVKEYIMQFFHFHPILLSKVRRLYKWLSPGNGGSAVRTHRAMLQLQGHGSQERPVKQVTAAHAPESGQGGKDFCRDSCNLNLLNKVIRLFGFVYFRDILYFRESSCISNR